jgi:3-phenylpropionate/trans-cinnamate dioxygenase ferredoxin reductase subunit
MEDTTSRIVIVGGGLAGVKTAEQLRLQGHTGSIILFAAEHDLPYERPPLSKQFLAGKTDFVDAVVHPQQWFTEHDVDLRSGEQVVDVRATAREVVLADGTVVEFDVLVLATGSEPRTLSVPGAETALRLRTRRDAETIRASFGVGKRLVVVGAGWIGLEVAAAARNAGTEVVVIESAEQPLSAVLGNEMGKMFAALHRQHGVDLHLETSVAEIDSQGVRLSDCTHVAADAVVVGIGAVPRTELAVSAGLEVDNGVLVDRSLRSSDPDIYAVGDIANQDHPTLGHRVRVEHWAAALNQPAVAAATIIKGSRVGTYDALPYFFSDQYDLGMEYVGYVPPGASTSLVVRGDVDKREFVALWLDSEDRVLAGMNVNIWDVIDDIKTLIRDRTPVDPARIADPSVPLSASTA